MSMPYPQQPAGQPAAPYAPGTARLSGGAPGVFDCAAGIAPAMRLCLKGL